MKDNRPRSILSVALGAVLVLWVAGVVAATLLWLRPLARFPNPGAARLVIFHVPCAIIAVIAYVVSWAYAIAYLARGNAASDVKSAVSAGLGFVFTVLATVTGMIFARLEWGSAWNWDPRETSILMLVIVYAAYFALRSALPGAVARARISASYNIIAGVVMPFFVFVMPRIAKASLHPRRASLSTDYLVVLLCSIAGFALLYLWLFLRLGRQLPKDRRLGQ